MVLDRFHDFVSSTFVDDLRRQYPLCSDYDGEDIVNDQGEPIVIGNGVCNDGKEYIEMYMNENCYMIFENKTSKELGV